MSVILTNLIYNKEIHKRETMDQQISKLKYWIIGRRFKLCSLKLHSKYYFKRKDFIGNQKEVLGNFINPISNEVPFSEP